MKKCLITNINIFVLATDHVFNLVSLMIKNIHFPIDIFSMREDVFENLVYLQVQFMIHFCN